MTAPTRPRELFDYFRLYDRASGLGGLIEDWDLQDVSPQQIYYSTLGRLPEGDRARKGEAYDPRAQYLQTLKSQEFQNGVVKGILRAYPEKKRMIFIHIPKCAGSHLVTRLIATYPTVNFRLMDENWTNKETLFESLHTLALRLENFDSIYPHGHLPLKWYINNRLIRFGDTPFAIVRDPAQVVLSQVNYILTRFARDREFKAIDTRDWLRFVDKSKVESSIANNDFRDLANDILFTEALVQRDLICKFLGNGTAQSAFEMCASASVELTDLAHYPEWLRLRLGVEVGQPANVSNRYVGADDLGADGLERIRKLTEQDGALVDKVGEILSETNQCWVSGAQLL